MREQHTPIPTLSPLTPSLRLVVIAAVAAVVDALVMSLMSNSLCCVFPLRVLQLGRADVEVSALTHTAACAN